MTFGNRTLAIHLLRGLLGLAALVTAVRGYDAIGWPALLLVGVTFWALKGCPVCWTIGLAETIAYRFLAHAEDGHDTRRT